MAKQTASIGAIEKLHGLIAGVLCEVIIEEEEITEMVEGAEGFATAQGTGKFRKSVSPAMMAQAINFVHKQGVVADVEGDKNTNRLKEMLEGKQKRSRLGNGKVASIEDAKQKAG